MEIGAIDKMTMSEAERWLANYIEEQGVNSEAHLARSQSSASLSEMQPSYGGSVNSSLVANHRPKAVWVANFESMLFPCLRTSRLRK